MYRYYVECEFVPTHLALSQAEALSPHRFFDWMRELKGLSDEMEDEDPWFLRPMEFISLKQLAARRIFLHIKMIINEEFFELMEDDHRHWRYRPPAPDYISEMPAAIALLHSEIPSALLCYINGDDHPLCFLRRREGDKEEEEKMNEAMALPPMTPAGATDGW